VALHFGTAYAVDRCPTLGFVGTVSVEGAPSLRSMQGWVPQACSLEQLRSNPGITTHAHPSGRLKDPN